MTEELDASAVADAIASAVGGPSTAPSTTFSENPPPPLPEGWVLKASRSSPGCFYYYHLDMEISSWQPPALEEEAVLVEKAVTSESEPVSRQRSSKPEENKPQEVEVSEERPSKRQKSQSAASGPKEVRVLHLLKKHKDSRRPSSWRQEKITQSKEEATEDLLGLLEILQEEEGNASELQATFEELARTESDCSSAKRGGDLGFFGRRKMQPAFEHASFALTIGELTKELVETSSGVHLILRIG
jgi:NIMA-interacting peptidyl-prolyl cis-trans isomerase 1